MKRTRMKWRIPRWGGIALCGVLVLLYVASVPFYSGSRLGSRFDWRMEHGRLRLARTPDGSTESFYIAMNTEGLRFRPEIDLRSLSNWRVNIPLWAPLGLAAGGTAWLWTAARRRRRDLERRACAACGYALSGLPDGSPCPECGSKRAGVA